MNANRPTIAELELIVESAGYTPFRAASWQNEEQTYVCSLESEPGTLGSPKCEIQWRHDGVVFHHGLAAGFDSYHRQFVERARL